jgi:hypothetical protein
MNHTKDGVEPQLQQVGGNMNHTKDAEKYQLGPQGERYAARGAIGPEEASPWPTDVQGASSNLPPPIRSASQLHQIEKDACDKLYRLVGEFTMQPGGLKFDEVYRGMAAYQIAWMAGRRRVMD